MARKHKFTVVFLLIALYIFTCYMYTVVSLRRERAVFNNYVNFLIPHVWQLDMKNMRRIVENMLKSTNAITVVIKDEYGGKLYEHSKTLNVFEKGLYKVGFLTVKKLVYDLSYEGVPVGKVEITVLRKYTYFYLYIALLFLSGYFVLASHLNLREVKDELENAKNELENTVSELENTIEELESTQEQLVNAEKMASLGRFVAGIAHDLNTPMGIIYTGLTEMKRYMARLEDSYKEGKMSKKGFEKFLEESKELLGLMEKNTKRVVDLVRSLKSVSAQETLGSPVRFRLNELIQDVLTAINPRLRRTKVEVEVRCPEDLEMVSYPGALSQVLLNLIENSIIHGFNDGEEEGKIKIEVEDKGAYVEFTYSDNGVGMDESTKSRAFEPFYTTRSGKGGTGLGLYIVYNLVVEMMGGEVVLESEPGKGTKFLIIIPKVVS